MSGENDFGKHRASIAWIENIGYLISSFEEFILHLLKSFGAILNAGTSFLCHNIGSFNFKFSVVFAFSGRIRRFKAFSVRSLKRHCELVFDNSSTKPD